MSSTDQPGKPSVANKAESLLGVAGGPSGLQARIEQQKLEHQRQRDAKQRAFERQMEELKLAQNAETQQLLGMAGQSSVSSNAAPSGDRTKSSSKPSMKDMTKAERRALQEKQRAEKAVLQGPAGASAPAKASGKPVAAKAPPPVPVSAQSRGVAARNALESTIELPHSLQLFLHLESPPSANVLSLSQRTNAVIHHSILRLAQLYAQFKIVGSNARCMAMLEAFKHVIHSYCPPKDTSFSRHLPTHLSPQISHLVQARPLSVSMGNAIRHLKGVISRIGVDVSDDQAKAYLYDRIDRFIRERIIVADQVIQSHAITKIKDGDVIMTYANSSVIQGVLLQAHQQGVRFSVVLVDSRPAYEAKNLLKLLSRAGIDCTYLLLTAIGPVLRTVSLVLLGAHAMLANGAIYGRAGTAMIAMISRAHGIPVVCCCETYKFSERVMLDSIVSNEMSTAQSTIPPASYHHLFRFRSSLPHPPETETKNKELSLLYDVARPEDVSMVITEAGIIPVQSVPVLLRDYKPLLGES